MISLAEFMGRLKLALDNPNIYATGAFGAPTGYKNNTDRYSTNTYDKGYKEIAKAILRAPAGTFMYDCIGLARAGAWGFSADPQARYGGSVYESNGFPACPIRKIDQYCNDWDADNKRYPVKGEILRNGDMNHVGIFWGNGEIIECTSAVAGIRIRDYKPEDWTGGHGKLNCVDYSFLPDANKYYDIGKLTCPTCGFTFEICARRDK